MREHDWFAGYPEPAEPRVVSPRHRTIYNRIAASYRDKEFYDGDRKNGYGGMVNDGRWEPIARRIVDEFGSYRRILQIGAHKGYLLYEMQLLMPELVQVWDEGHIQFRGELIPV